MKSLFCLVLTLMCLVNGAQSGPHSVGQPWPKPQHITQTTTKYSLSAGNFQFRVTGTDCDLLRGAFHRYFKIIFHNDDISLRFHPRNFPRNFMDSQITHLDVSVNRCEEYPSLGMDESYTLSVKDDQGLLTCNSIWGALRGLETFSQLVFEDDTTRTLLITETWIQDAPRFSHRGILLDSSRHFLPVNAIKANLEAMAYNKINVFHWHIVDDQSFPYQSRDFPDMSAKGAYNAETHIYTQLEVKEIIEFARQRGIRVVAEFDTPGHTQSWGPSTPGFLTKCCDKTGNFNGNYGPIDPSNQDNYAFLDGFVKELTEVFPDHYLHLGGDEVSFGCWASNPNITAFMNKSGFGTDYAKLENYYEQKLLDIVNSHNSGYIAWQEIFDNKIQIRDDTVVHAWKGNWKDEMAKITAANYKVIVSTPWYLDYIAYAAQWKNYYQVEPLSFNGTDKQKSLVMGGEACLWGEYVDGSNVVARLWPRASAVAERLWSPQSVNDVNAAVPRLEEHHCRMLKRGITAEPPTGPNFCKYETKVPDNPLWY